MKFIILGSGSSMGVPRPDGFFGNCDPKNPKNSRTRCSALIKSKDISSISIIKKINNTEYNPKKIKALCKINNKIVDINIKRIGKKNLF